MRSRRAIINIPRAFRVGPTGPGDRDYNHRRQGRYRWYRKFMQKSLITVPHDESVRQRVTLGRVAGRHPILHLVTLYKTYVRTKRLIADLRSVCETAVRQGTGKSLLFRRSYTVDSIMYRNNFAGRLYLALLSIARYSTLSYYRRRHPHCRRRCRKVIRAAHAPGNINPAVLLCHLRFIPTVNGAAL